MDGTPLTAAVLGGWFALPGAVALMMAIDGRWSAARITLESQLIGLGLILVAVVRAWDEFDTSEPAAYLFAAGIAALFVGLAVFYFAMLTRQRVSTRGRRVAAGMARETT
jgi:hypothetical protein